MAYFIGMIKNSAPPRQPLNYKVSIEVNRSITLTTIKKMTSDEAELILNEIRNENKINPIESDLYTDYIIALTIKSRGKKSKIKMKKT